MYNKNYTNEKKTITIWHPNGEKYFSYLQNYYNINFVNIYFFRKIFNYHKFTNEKKFIKPFFLSDFNIICLPPFDLNIIFFLIGKILKPKACLILHTSDFVHDKGYIFKFFISKYIYQSIINKLFKFIIYPNKLQLDHLNQIYKPKKLYIPHHINPCFYNNKFIKKDIDILFVGEKSYKKGYDRFIKITNLLNLKSYAIGKSNLKVELNNNCINIENIDQIKLSQYLSRSKYLILPSRRFNNWEELFSQITIESISSGVIVLSTNHIGPVFLKNYYNLPIYLFKDDDDFVLNVVNFINKNKIFIHFYDLSDFKIGSLIHKWEKIFK